NDENQDCRCASASACPVGIGLRRYLGPACRHRWCDRRWFWSGGRRPGGLANRRTGVGRWAGRRRYWRRHVQGPEVGPKSDRSAQQQPELLVEHAQHVVEAVAVGELARARIDHVAALCGARYLGDREQGLLGGVAEDRED